MGRKAEQLYKAVGMPPDTLEATEFVAKIIKARGNSAYEVSVPPSGVDKVRQAVGIPADYPLNSTDDVGLVLIVDMPPKFRNTLFVKRGGYVLVGIKDDLSLVYAASASQEIPEPAEESAEVPSLPAAKVPKTKAKGKNALKQQFKTSKLAPTEGGAATEPTAATPSKLKTHETTATGEIINVIVSDRAWKKMPWWPAEYAGGTQGWDAESDGDSDEDDSDGGVRDTRGTLPPSDDEDDVEYY